jgi:hypothetical protein
MLLLLLLLVVLLCAAARLHSERAAGGGDVSVKLSWGKTQEAAALLCVMNMFPDALLEEVRRWTNSAPPLARKERDGWVGGGCVWLCGTDCCLRNWGKAVAAGAP